MSTPPKPPSRTDLLALESDLHHAERYLHLCDLLFQPPRSNALIMHDHDEGVFRLFSQASYTAALLALRRCVDSSVDSSGLKSLERAGRIESLQLSPALLSKVKAFCDQRLSHSDPRATNAQWWDKNQLTRGEFRTFLAEVRAAIEHVTNTHGRRAVRQAEFSDIDEGVERLIEDVHLAAHLRQLKDRAQCGLSISAPDVLAAYRPETPHEKPLRGRRTAGPPLRPVAGERTS